MLAPRLWLLWLADQTGLAENKLVALLILLGGLPVAFFARMIVALFVRRLAGLGGALGSPLRTALARYELDALLGRGAFWLIVVVTLMTGTELLGLPGLTGWLGGVAAYLPRVVAAASVLLAGFVFGSLVQEALRRAPAVGQNALPTQMAGVVRAAVIGVAFIVALQQLGVRISFFANILSILLAALVGGGALAFAFGSRGTVANILAGHYVRELYEVGQKIRIGDLQGRVVRITGTAVLISTAAGETAVPSKMFLEMPSTRLTGEEQS